MRHVILIHQTTQRDVEVVGVHHAGGQEATVNSRLVGVSNDQADALLQIGNDGLVCRVEAGKPLDDGRCLSIAHAGTRVVCLVLVGLDVAVTLTGMGGIEVGVGKHQTRVVARLQ